ncbi:MAG: hypothetical protein EOM20_06665, partial [Spartobacteria bacterium]|nr:hypothetical protein [Spartobacteria bacterium]
MSVFFTLPLYSQAQEDDPEEEYFPRREITSMTYTYEGKADFKDQEGHGETSSAEMHELRLRLTAPLYFGERWRLMSGLSMQWNHFNFTGGETTDEDTYMFSVPFRAMIDLTEKWKFMGTLAPSIYSDMERLSEDSLKASAIALGMYTYSPQWTFAIGAA